MTAPGDDYVNQIEAGGVKVEKREDVYVLGSPAVILSVHDVNDSNPQMRSDAVLWGKVLLAVKDGVLYKVAVNSVYNEIPQFERVANSLAITGAPGAKSGATAAS